MSSRCEWKEKEKKILETFGKVVPELSELEKERLLAFGEGLAFKVGQQYAQAPPATPVDQDSE